MTLRINIPDNDLQFELLIGAEQATALPASDRIPESELSDSELLAQALREATEAREAGVITGPELDEVALRRAERRARRADRTRQDITVADTGEATA